MPARNLALTIPPGIFRNGTNYQARGRWHDGNLVRFYSGTIEPVGGWRTTQTDASVDVATLSGVPRGCLAWRAGSNVFIALATINKLYVLTAGTLYDITPAGFVTGQADVTVSSGAYGAGAYGVGTYGGGSATSTLTDPDTWQLDTFGDYLLGVCTSDKKLYIWLGNTANPAISIDFSAGTGAPTTCVGVAATPERYLFALGTGGNNRRVMWPNQQNYNGASGPIITPSGTVTATAGAATFSVSQAGVVHNGDVLVVSGTSYTVSSFNGTTACTLTPSATFGATAFTQQTSVWAPTVTNTAGSWDLVTDGRIMCGQRTKVETLIWTDVDLHAARFIGGTYVYRFDQVGDKCGIVSRRAKAVVDTTAFWMGKNNFFMYDGFTRSLESDVRDYVFSDINKLQLAKIWAMSIAEFGEVWWFYPSQKSNEIDRYVVYNYRENHWNIGTLVRTAGADAGASQYPIMLDATGKVYDHEVNQSRPAIASAQPGIELLTELGILIVAESGDISLATEQTAPFLESGPIQLGEGETLLAIESLIPDEKTLGDVRAFIYSALYPTSLETQNGPYYLANPTDVRITARQVRVRLEEVQPTDWRVGTLRLGVRPDSRR